MALSDFPFADSISGGNSVAAPGAGSSFVSIAAPAAGIYDIDYEYALTATAETALTNAQVRANGATLVGSLPTLSGTGWARSTVKRVTLDGANPVQLRAAAAAIAGSQYSGIITLTRIG